MLSPTLEQLVKVQISLLTEPRHFCSRPEPDFHDIVESKRRVLDLKLKPRSKATAKERVAAIAQLHELAKEEAARWAVWVWRSWYWGLLARKADLNGVLPHELGCVEGISVATDLAERYLSDSIAAVSFAKTQITYLAAVIFQSEDLPEFADPDFAPSSDMEEETRRRRRRGILGGGWIYRMCSNLMRRGRHRNVSNRQVRSGLDILMSKFGGDRVSDDFIAGALDSHRRRLTRWDERFDTEQSVQDLYVVSKVAEELVKEMFQNETFSPSVMMPSLHATVTEEDKNRFESGTGSSKTGGRASGGAFAKLAEEWCSGLFDSEIENLPPETSTRVESKVFYSQVSEPGSVRLREQEGSIHANRIVKIVGDNLVRSFLDHVEKGIKPIENGGLVCCVPCPIPEPYKIRVITKEEAEPTYATLCLQKFMHGVIRKFPLFEYVGRPIDLRTWSEHFKTIKPGQVFHSGDFKDASDGIHPWLSRFIMRSIAKYANFGSCMKLADTPWAILGEQCLVHHRLYGFMQEPIEQMCGQLMGSTVSFPVLCIGNAASAIASLGISVKDVLRVRGPMVVNGDDLGAVSDTEHLEIWKRMTSSVGLRPSLGKNYRTRKFLIMNSECHVAKIHADNTVQWERENFLNQSLLFSIEKKGLDSGRCIQPYVSWPELGAKCRALIQDVPERDQRTWRNWFCWWHAPNIAEIPAGISRFSSPDLGGAGIPYLPGDSISLWERRTAALIACRPLKHIPSRMTKTWFQKEEAACEKYYKQFLPVVQSERTDFEIMCEWRGLTRIEESSIGAACKIAWILDAWVKDSIAPLKPKNAWERNHPEALKTLFSWDRYKNSPEFDTRFPSKYQVFKNGLIHLIVRAGKEVADHEKALEPLGLDLENLFGRCHCRTCSGLLHPMDVVNLVKWSPPVEDLIQWGYLEYHTSSLHAEQLEVDSKRQDFLDPGPLWRIRKNSTRIFSSRRTPNRRVAPPNLPTLQDPDRAQKEILAMGLGRVPLQPLFHEHEIAEFHVSQWDVFLDVMPLAALNA